MQYICNNYCLTTLFIPHKTNTSTKTGKENIT